MGQNPRVFSPREVLTMRCSGKLLAAVSLLFTACGEMESPPDRSTFSTETFALKACPDGEMLDGIDVSKWQGAIDWTAVAADGIDFAFIRVSDGLYYQDAYFQANWSEAKANGIVRGVYQFFRSDEDPVAQAQYLLDEMGPLEPGDLPPVCDVETADGQSAATIADRVQTWLDVVEGALGVKPLIYTSPGVWGSIVNSGAFSDYPLWVAHWGASCPTMPTGWTDWVVWQTSDNGSIAGISGDVDTNKFNGGMAALQAFGTEGSLPPGPPRETATPCVVTGQGNTIVEEDGPCSRRLGPVHPERYTDVSGHGGHAWWTAADELAPGYSEGVEWLFDFAEAGLYKVWAHVPSGLDALTPAASYEVVHAAGVTSVTVDQAANAGDVVLLGAFNFVLGADGQSVRVLDSYVDSASQGLRVALDAVEVGPANSCACTEVGTIESLPCGGSGFITRECDGCQWSEWSACDGHGDAGGADGGSGPYPDGLSGGGPDDVTGPTVHAYTSATTVTNPSDAGCAGGSRPVTPLPWLGLMAWLSLGVLRRSQRPSRAKSSATP